MTSETIRSAIPRRDPNARIRLDLTVPEAILLYSLAYLAHASGTRVTLASPPAEEDAAVLNRVTCKIYTALRENRGRGL